MVVRIQYRHLVRLAQRQETRAVLPNRRHFQTSPSFAAVQCQRLRPFSTSPTKRQEPRQTPAPPDSEPAAVPPEPADPSSTPTTTQPPPPEPSPSPQQQQKPKSRLAPRLILAITCTLLGISAGSSVRLLLSPPQPPAPHTEEDDYTIRVLHDQAAKLPIVQQLTAAAAAAAAGDDEPTAAAWESWDAYESLSPEHKAQHISAGALAGSRGVCGYQRVFWNRATGEVVSVIYFGAATAGWPGVVHGGCLATVLDESCGRAAFREWSGRPGLTASLGLEYKKVTLANGFYVVRSRVRPEEELPETERGKRHYKCWVDATVEDAATGLVTVVAEALFVGGQGKGKNGQPGGPLDEDAREKHLKF